MFASNWAFIFWIKTVFTALVLAPVCLLQVSDAAETAELNGQLSLNASFEQAQDEWANQLTLGYMPELSFSNELSDNLVFNFNASTNLHLSRHPASQPMVNSSVDLYRLNTQLNMPQSDIRVGLQKLNFGPAYILRSLRWFDQIDPTDPLNLTNGVNGIRYRYFFPNNANVWLWGLYGNKEPKGFEQVPTRINTPEVGARIQLPVLSGELGASIHMRETERLGFTGIDVDTDLTEKRIALDGRWDIGPGVWFEVMLVDQGAVSKSTFNWFSTASAGTDYTLGIGNGFHILAEHNISQITEDAFDWDIAVETSAIQVTYPLSILDAVSVLDLIFWTENQNKLHLSWNRAYDSITYSLTAFLSKGQSNNKEVTSSGTSGNGVRAVVVFNH